MSEKLVLNSTKLVSKGFELIGETPEGILVYSKDNEGGDFTIFVRITPKGDMLPAEYLGKDIMQLLTEKQ